MGRSEHRPASAPAWHSSPPSVIHRKSSTPASVSPFVMSKSALCALTEDWNRTECLRSLCEGPPRPEHPVSQTRGGAREEDVFLRMSSNACQIPSKPVLKPVPCTMLICHSKWLTRFLLLDGRLIFSFFNCLFFAGWILLQLCRESERVHESHG